MPRKRKQYDIDRSEKEKNGFSSESAAEDITASDDAPAVVETETAVVPEEGQGEPVDTVIRIGETAAESKKLNGFDRFWIKVWSVIVSAIGAIAGGINFVIFKIFKKRLPDRYVKAFVAIVIVILLILLVTAPFKITVNDVEQLNIYNDGLTPVYMRVADSADNGYPIYKWGYADSRGRVVIACIYDDVTEFKHGVAFVNYVEDKGDGVVENYWYLIDTSGNRRGSLNFFYSTELGASDPVGEFGDDDRLAPVYVGGKYGYINTRGEMAINAAYDEAGVFIDGYARVRLGSTEYFINTKGEDLTDTRFEEVRDFCGGYAAVKQNDLWMFLDRKGDVLSSNNAPLVFDKVTDFTNGYALVRNGTTLSIIDADGHYVISGNTFNDLKVAEYFDTSWW